MTDEAASRLILQTYLEDEGDGALREITTPSRAELVPDMQLRGIAPQPSLNAQSLTYQQSASNIPIFGGRVVVDIDAHDKTLVSINGRVAPMPDISSVASVSQLQAWKNLVNWSGAKNPPNAPETSPLLTWFLDEGQEKWRLVYHFAAVPFAPPDADSDEGHACVRPSFRSNRAYDYFVDAHNGDVAFWFPSAPGLDIPSPMTGMDCFNVQRQFYGLSGQGGFSLVDPLRNIETYDYTYQDIDQNPAPPFPAGPIVNPTSNMAAASPQAVSAHYHAGLVSDFYNNEMKRSGIDNKGMKLVSVVNVYSSDRNPLPSPQWGNAVWFQGKMWYGEENGVSFAKYLDVIAHELTHGVTESSSNLVYRNIPGALNESYSDIFGVIIANWYPSQPNSIGTWNWKIGAGLGQAGGPIRNFADPAAAGQPDHMNQYRPITRDYGGVHIYSGIHNKAIYKLLTATEHGQPVFPTRELALLLYLTLTRLTQMSDFSDSRRTLKNVAGVYYASTTPADLSTKLGAIDAAFDSVGIT
ncbi:MAG: M4 family metallopeptidase [Hyphomicrobiales bacterium]|nr:M4 family metallopeptidase [Hyphomicrobiales bacterium]MBV8824914.1 M4 family metallopeptidase [Hyphomicrobiales bacterium]MBV9429589.1 M4 family metallopeptidase [Bradyrhizobiaceae bacterium]